MADPSPSPPPTRADWLPAHAVARLAQFIAERRSGNITIHVKDGQPLLMRVEEVLSLKR